MIKVCMVVHEDYYIERRVRYACEALALNGVHVDVLCLRPEHGDCVAPPLGVRIFSNTRLHTSEKPWTYVLEYGATLLLFTTRLLGLFLRNRYDVIHVHNMPDFLIFTALVPKIFGSKLILDIHDPMPEFYISKYPDRGGYAVRLLRVQEKLCCKLADEVITANPNFKNNLVARGIPREKVTVVMNVPNPAVFDRRKRLRHSTGEQFTLIYPGTVAPRYGLDVAIRALPALSKRIPQVRLVILGAEGSYAKYLRDMAAQLRVELLVNVHSQVPAEEVVRQMAEADVGIYPALSSPHMDIATPTKVMEYAVMGVPIVASRLEVLQQLFGDSAIKYFKAGSVEQFVDCIVELYNSPRLREELVRKADQAFVRAYPHSSEQGRYFQVMNRLLGTHKLDVDPPMWNPRTASGDTSPAA